MKDTCDRLITVTAAIIRIVHTLPSRVSFRARSIPRGVRVRASEFQEIKQLQEPFGGADGSHSQSVRQASQKNRSNQHIQGVPVASGYAHVPQPLPETHTVYLVILATKSMSKNLLSNRDLNRYYDDEGSGIEPLLLTKKLDVDAEAFRAQHGFGDDGILNAAWCRKFSATRKRLGHDNITAPDNRVYNSATPPTAAKPAPPEVDPRFIGIVRRDAE